MKPISDPCAEDLERLWESIVRCERCPRLREHCRAVAAKKVRRFSSEDYWGLPVPGFGDPAARILLLGLAPAAHGGNRTGRVFTGDRSGDFLCASLYRAGLASQAESRSRQDGMRLHDVWISALVRCAPPGNQPLAAEVENCLDHLACEVDLLPRLQVLVALGGFAWAGLRTLLRRRGWRGNWPRFRHGAEFEVGPWRILAAYHPSQQNTFTGRVTAAMYDELFARIERLLEVSSKERSDRAGERAPRQPS